MSNVRIHRSPLSRAERAAIDWILPRLPEWVTADKLTAFGTFGAFLTLVGYSATNWHVGWLWLANLGVLIHWFGDSLDGNVARYRKMERPQYGYFLDQTIDVLGNFLICFGMGLSPFVDMRAALCALAGYHMVSIYVFVRANIDREFHVTVLNFGPTEMRAVIVLMNLCILVLGVWNFTILGYTISWPSLSVGLWAMGFMIAFIYLISKYAPILRDADDRTRVEAREKNAASP
ncbi:MAG: CDP-alcohol phosphatidyltransferase [Rhizobiales bacterium PAR1]|nr:MAG: CDP-alcohol phosphatidyltransferase [Rhizobiales bacterium PAR1]